MRIPQTGNQSSAGHKALVLPLPPGGWDSVQGMRGTGLGTYVSCLLLLVLSVTAVTAVTAEAVMF